MLKKLEDIKEKGLKKIESIKSLSHLEELRKEC